MINVRTKDRFGRHRDPLARLTPAELSDYAERAAILEHEAGLTQPEAERQALLCVLKARGLPWVQN